MLLPKDLDKVIASEHEAWTAELEQLRSDPRVMKFLKLQERIARADELIVVNPAQPPSNRYRPFDPYDAYDVFEFARDLAGKEISALALSELADGRFPDMSGEGRGRMMDYLIENGRLEATRRTQLGRPTSSDRCSDPAAARVTSPGRAAEPRGGTGRATRALESSCSRDCTALRDRTLVSRSAIAAGS